MSQTTFLFSTLGSFASSLLFLHIGNVLRRRKVSADAVLANRMFVLWWMSLGGLGLVGVAQNLAYLAGWLPIWLYQAAVSGILVILFLALWGLQFYLVYLYTGSRRSFAPLGVFYGLLYFATMALVAYIGRPETITDNGWSLQTEPTIEFSMAFNLGFSLFIIGPQLFAAIAYAQLYRKTEDATQRYRIAMVTGSIGVWFGSGFVATLLSISDQTAWLVTSRLISVLAALAILFAYRPPKVLRKRYGLEAIELTTRPSETARPPAL